ncbi:MAG: histidinol dehydrogenase [Acidimicrobiia bacterium]
MTIDISTIILADIEPAERTALVTRAAVPDDAVRQTAAAIVAEVGTTGDAALKAYGKELGGGASTGELRVDGTDMKRAFTNAAPELIKALDAAIAAIRIVHHAQIPTEQEIAPAPGVTVTRRWSPLRRVGVYVPGGGASYPSSLLMGVVPAQVAGVRDIAVVCPASSTGAIDDSVLTAAHMLGITEMYTAGGAQAIGALAHGTETIPRVQKIVGPGGAWVTAAKLAVYGRVGVDLPAGPSEAAVVVDSATDPAIAAADLLCQAEHGPESVVALITSDRGAAERIVSEVELQLERLARSEIIRKALSDHGLVIIAPNHADALIFADEWAPEHVSILTETPHSDARAITAAGSVLLGVWTPESAGDYATGANHILPTGGLAAAYGPVSTEDFGSWTQVQELTRDGLEHLAPTIRSLAQQEGLTAHAACVDARLKTPLVQASL